MGIDQKLVQKIIRRIKRVSKPERIILFGSAATRKMNRDSDIDILILKAAPRRTNEEWIRIRESLRGLGYPFDIIIMSTGRFEESKNIIGGIAFPAHKYGKVIYEAK